VEAATSSLSGIACSPTTVPMLVYHNNTATQSIAWEPCNSTYASAAIKSLGVACQWLGAFGSFGIAIGNTTYKHHTHESDALACRGEVRVLPV
jgi:hypothetical protein